MLKAIRLTFAVLVLAAIGRQLFLHVAADFSALNFFSYFTNLLNLFAALVLLLGLAARRGRMQDLLNYASTVNMAVVGLVFAVLLRDVDLGALLPWINAVLHYLMPVAIVLNWLIDPPRSTLGRRDLLIAMVFPALYLAYVIGRGAIVGWYPYPFLNPAQAGGYAAVAAYALGIGATFLAASWALLALGRRRAAARGPGAEA